MRAEDLEGNKMIETIVKVDGMMCGMCESHVNEAVRKAFPEVKKGHILAGQGTDRDPLGAAAG